MADYMYRKLNVKDEIIICGRIVSINNKIKVKVEEIEIIK